MKTVCSVRVSSKMVLESFDCLATSPCPPAAVRVDNGGGVGRWVRRCAGKAAVPALSPGTGVVAGGDFPVASPRECGLHVVYEAGGALPCFVFGDFAPNELEGFVVLEFFEDFGTPCGLEESSAGQREYDVPAEGRPQRARVPYCAFLSRRTDSPVSERASGERCGNPRRTARGHRRWCRR